MKIWLKILISGILGIAAGLIIPADSGIKNLADTLYVFLLSAGRYMVFPLVFVSVLISSYELRSEKKLVRLLLRTFAYSATAVLIVIIFSLISMKLFSPGRIPIIIEEENLVKLISVKDLLVSIFPANSFSIFQNSGNFIFPVILMALLTGTAFAWNRLSAKPAVQFFEALNSSMYHLSTVFIEISSFFFFALTFYFIFQIKSFDEIKPFYQLLLALGINALILVFGVFPGLLYLLEEKSSPYKNLYAGTGPALSGLFSGDSYFTYPVLYKHIRENIGVNHKAAGTLTPFLLIFGRLGTAFITASAFMIILKSYSSINIGLLQILWICGASFTVSMFTGLLPGMNAYIALSLLCSMYGRGLSEGYLILKPVLPFLLSLSVMIDMIGAAFISALTAKHEGMCEDVKKQDFI
jgi:Na+/H+-dicarboxylate symporter